LIGSKAIALGEVTQINGHYDVVQGHSRSPILVPIESRMRLPIRK